jgi:hypothetical protein
MRSHHERNVLHLLPRNLLQSRKVLLVHLLQLIAPHHVGDGHNQNAVDKAQRARLLCNGRAAYYWPSEQWSLIASFAADIVSENLLQRAARVLHGVKFDSRAVLLSLEWVERNFSGEDFFF